MEQPGLYGKLPTHGDFVTRNLPANMLNEWDYWLKHYIAGTKEQIGEAWLDIYLTSPIWRFVMSHGVLDENKWAGVILPSVDSVGRYFPFSLMVKLDKNINPLEFIALQSGWYVEVENIALQALDGAYTLDELVSDMSSTNYEYTSCYPVSAYRLDASELQIDMEYEEQSASAVIPHILDPALCRLFNSYSAWQTTGSEHVAPCFFCAQGLPDTNKLPAMLDGKWQYWGWQQPYRLAADKILDN